MPRTAARTRGPGRGGRGAQATARQVGRSALPPHDQAADRQHPDADAAQQHDDAVGLAELRALVGVDAQFDGLGPRAELLIADVAQHLARRAVDIEGAAVLNAARLGRDRIGRALARWDVDRIGAGQARRVGGVHHLRQGAVTGVIVRHHHALHGPAGADWRVMVLGALPGAGDRGGRTAPAAFLDPAHDAVAPDRRPRHARNRQKQHDPADVETRQGVQVAPEGPTPAVGRLRRKGRHRTPARLP